MRSIEIIFKDSDPEKTTEVIQKIAETIQSSGLIIEESSHAGSKVDGMPLCVTGDKINEKITNGLYFDTKSTIHIF